jgi:16S rRNA processing protein RimM
MGEQEEPWDLVVGRVAAPFGVRGAVRVRPETDSPERFRDLRQVRLGFPDGRELPVRIRSARVTPKGVIVQFVGYDTPEQAAALRGALVLIRRSMAAPLAAGSYYEHELVGMRVVSDDGADLGEITEVLHRPANDVFVTSQDRLIPALKQVVREVDVARRRMVVSLPPEEAA